jgi:hypothetical protein
LRFWGHPNIRVSFFFWYKSLFSYFVSSSSTRMPIFGMVSCIPILNHQKILLRFLEHSNIWVSHKFFFIKSLFSSFVGGFSAKFWYGKLNFSSQQLKSMVNAFLKVFLYIQEGKNTNCWISIEQKFEKKSKTV